MEAEGTGGSTNDVSFEHPVATRRTPPSAKNRT
jgi:hypothetical protein